MLIDMNGDGSYEMSTVLPGCQYESCDDDGGDDDGDSCDQYSNLYCDDSGSVIMGQDCGDESCGSCQVMVDYTAYTEGDYTCDGAYMYYMGGTWGALPGCYYESCEDDDQGADDNSFDWPECVSDCSACVEDGDWECMQDCESGE